MMESCLGYPVAFISIQMPSRYSYAGILLAMQENLTNQIPSAHSHAFPFRPYITPGHSRAVVPFRSVSSCLRGMPVYSVRSK
jgi:hypothetical protein